MRKIILLLLVTAFAACTSESLSVKQATSLIQDYTAKYPYFEKTTLRLGEQKFSIKKDAAEIAVLKNLETENLISLKSIDLHKKLLSKDSVWVVNIGLTAEASKYVLDQKKNRAEVKTYLFTLEKDSDVDLELHNKTKATAKAKLIKNPTPFAGLSSDKNPNTAFMTRDFILKYKKETGWYVQK